MLFLVVFISMFIFFAFVGMSWTSRIVCLASIFYSIAMINNPELYPFKNFAIDGLESSVLMFKLFAINMVLISVACWLGIAKKEAHNIAEYREKRKNCLLFFLKWGSIYTIFSIGLKHAIAYIFSLFSEDTSYVDVTTISTLLGGEIVIFIFFLILVGIYKMIRNV